MSHSLTLHFKGWKILLVKKIFKGWKFLDGQGPNDDEDDDDGMTDYDG